MAFQRFLVLVISSFYSLLYFALLSPTPSEWSATLQAHHASPCHPECFTFYLCTFGSRISSGREVKWREGASTLHPVIVKIISFQNGTLTSVR